MRLLVLGGTGFVGRHIVQRALARGDEVTLFNRGRTAPGLFPEAELLRGDRAGDLRALREGGAWDAAIDVTGYHPEHVAASSRLLAGRVERLTFISTISVYDDVSRPGVDEDAPTAPLTSGGWEDYGALKARCELAAHEALPRRALIIRPGVVAGPHDPTNRFSAWVRRGARGGDRRRRPAAVDRRRRRRQHRLHASVSRPRPRRRPASPAVRADRARYARRAAPRRPAAAGPGARGATRRVTPSARSPGQYASCSSTV